MEIKTVELLNELNELRKARGMSEAYLAAGETLLINGERTVGYELRTIEQSNLNTEQEIQFMIEHEIGLFKKTPF